jgi:hypothetical protein
MGSSKHSNAHVASSLKKTLAQPAEFRLLSSSVMMETLLQ